MTIAEALSIRLAELMKQKGINAYRLYLKTGVNQTTIWDIIKKRNASVNIRIIFELCQGLEVDIFEFFNSPIFKNENIVD